MVSKDKLVSKKQYQILEDYFEKILPKIAYPLHISMCFLEISCGEDKVLFLQVFLILYLARTQYE